MQKSVIAFGILAIMVLSSMSFVSAEDTSDSLPFNMPNAQVATCPPGQNYENEQAVCKPIASNPSVSTDSVSDTKTEDNSVTPETTSSNAKSGNGIFGALAQLWNIFKGLFGF